MHEATRDPDIIYIGFPKSAATFLNQFFSAHPEVHVDRKAKRYVHGTDEQGQPESDLAERNAAKLYVSFNEKVSDARLMVGGQGWKAVRFDPAMANRLDEIVEISPRHFAQSLKQRFPDCGILMCIRDQADWLASNYRYQINNMQGKQRSFLDFCCTPMGRMLLALGHYDLTISAYLEVFGPEKVHVLRFEELKQDRDAFLKGLCAFAGIEPIAFTAPAANVGRSDLATALHRKAHLVALLPPALRRLGRPLVDLLGGLQKSRGALTESERRFIESVYAVSNQRTRKLLAEIAAARAAQPERLLRGATPR